MIKRQPFVAVIIMAMALLLMNDIIADPAQAARSDQVAISSLQHADGGRLLIEWATPVRVLQKREGNRLVLRFSKPISFDARPALGSLAAYLDVERTKIEGTDLIVALEAGTSANLEIKRQRVVTIDFSRKQPDRPKVEFNVSTLTNGVRLAMNWPHPPNFDSQEREGKLFVTVVSDSRIDSKDLSHLNETLQPWFSKVQHRSGQANASLVFNLRPMIVSSVRGDGNLIIVDLTRDASTFTEASKNTPIPVIKPRAHDLASKQAVLWLPPIPEKRPEISALPVHTDNSEVIDDIVTVAAEQVDELVFDWKSPVGSAVFKRAGYLWVVFDTPPESSRSNLPPPAPAPLMAGEMVQVENATIIRYRMESDADFITRHDGRGRWIIRPHPGLAFPDPIPILAAGSPGTLQAIGVSSGRVVDVIDPIVGDQISIWPLMQARVGQQARRRFVDLEVLESIQGLVWRPLNDRMTVSAIPDGIKFSSARGLALSSRPSKPSEDDVTAGRTFHSPEKQPKREDTENSRIASGPKDTPENDQVEPEQVLVRPSVRKNEVTASLQQATRLPSSYLDLEGLALDRALVAETRRLLRQAVWKSVAEERDLARLNLAKLLVAERLASEAKIVLGNIAENAQDPIATSKRALQGASAFLSGDLDRASVLLGASEFDRDEEIGIWRAALNSLDKDWQSAAEGWKSSDRRLDNYPPKLRLELGLLALETAIETNDDTMVRKGIRRLKALELKPHEMAQIDRLHALRAMRDGDLPRAEEILQDLADGNFHDLSLVAELELASMAFSRETDDPYLLASLHDRLPLWRGHPQEINMIDSLASWYREAKEPRVALQLWGYLSKVHPETRDDPRIKHSRQTTFAEAINQLAGREIELLDAYSIYLDFTSLLPEGADAKVVHRNLAGILAELDLVNESVDVLRPLLEAATDDVEQAEIGVELAKLLILQDQASEALAVLKRTELRNNTGLDMLVAERRILKARTLVRLDRDGEALRQLQDLQTLAAQRLRAEVFWKRREWSQLASVIDSFLSDPRLSHPLNQDDQKFVLWLALAQGNLGQAGKLDELRQNYAAEMSSRTWSEALLIGTQAQKQRGDVVSVLANVEKQLTELRRFQENTKTKP